jgi:hypothetical protein
MIKLVYALDRRTDVPEKEFYDYWLNSHGPRVRSHAEAIRARKYVQSHTFDTPANEGLRAPRGMLPPIAGITEVWWDSLEDFQAATEDSLGRAALADLAEDEAKFINIAGSQVFLTQEFPIFDYTAESRLGPESIKCTYLLSRREDLTVSECHGTWLNDHGPLVKSFSKLLGMAKYVQSHTIAEDVNQGFVESRGLAEPLDGITEVWIADPNAGPAPTADSRRAGDALVEDEKRFVEMGRSRCFMTKEHLIFDYT